MSTINQQPLANPLELSDLIAVWSAGNSDTRRSSLTALLALIQANLSFPVTPVAPGVVIFMPFVGGTNTLIVSPAPGVVLPAAPAFGQTIEFISVGTNTGPTTVKVGAQATVDVEYNGNPLVGGELIAGGTFFGIFDGVAYQLVATSLDANSEVFINVKDYGAIGNGVANDSAAITLAINAAAASGGGTVYFPRGTYLTTPLVFGTKDNVRLLGDGRFASTIALSAAGTLLTFSTCQWFSASQLTFKLNGAPQGIALTYGVLMDTASGNSHFDDCAFVGFALDGLRLTGTVGTPLSGHKVTNCYFLGNGGNQFRSTYSNDFHYENNQYGSLVGVAHAAIGCLLDHSSAGTYAMNYHWKNVIGMKADTCNYNTYSENRSEESDQQNYYITAGANVIFNANKGHTGSQTASGTYDNIYFTGVTGLIVTSNECFTFNATYTRNGINIDAGCTGVTLGKNRVDTPSFDAANFGPIRVDGGVFAVGIGVDRVFQGCTVGTVAAGLTRYLGCNAQQANEFDTYFATNQRYAVIGFWVNITGAPGAGETNTYTLMKAAAATAMAGTITGAASFALRVATTAPQILVPYETVLTLRLVTTNNGAYVAASHRYFIALVEY